MSRQVDLLHEPIVPSLLRFCLPLIAGNLLQQLYNVVDTWVVGRWLGPTALAAVGSAFSLMVLLTSIVLGLCLGAGVIFSRSWGAGDHAALRRNAGSAAWICLGTGLVLTAAACLLLPLILQWLQVPAAVLPGMQTYLRIVLPGLLFTSVYNYAANLQRSVGNSFTPLLFLSISAVLNILLDLLLVAVWPLGIAGAAWATLIAQGISAAGVMGFTLLRTPALLPHGREWLPDRRLLHRIVSVSALTAVQQSVMNFGILMVQGLVNSFGPQVMAAFAVGVKIDAFAYAPAQDFAAGYATFISQNSGAGQTERVRTGMRWSFLLSVVFCTVVSVLVGLLAPFLMQWFMPASPAETVAIGIHYLRTEGLCYAGIGILFLMYATFRAIEQPGISVLLTVISLGLRVLLSYTLAPLWGTGVIWWSIPIGWGTADLTGWLLLYRRELLQRR